MLKAPAFFVRITRNGIRCDTRLRWVLWFWLVCGWVNRRHVHSRKLIKGNTPSIWKKINVFPCIANVAIDSEWWLSKTKATFLRQSQLWVFQFFLLFFQIKVQAITKLVECEIWFWPKLNVFSPRRRRRRRRRSTKSHSTLFRIRWLLFSASHSFVCEANVRVRCSMKNFCLRNVMADGIHGIYWRAPEDGTTFDLACK